MRIRKGEIFRSIDTNYSARNSNSREDTGLTSNRNRSGNEQESHGKRIMQKIAIILHAAPGTHDAMGRALHSLLYTKELIEAGHIAKLFFDGGGTKWVEVLSKPGHPLGHIFAEVKESGAISGVCQYCICAFEGNAEEVKAAGLPVTDEYMGHPSIAALVGEGYQIITL